MKTVALILLLTFCGTSYAEISKITVNKAWKRITKADGFTRIPITYEKDTEPNAWVEFEGDGGKNFSVHVTKGLMRVLDTEDEIAGVLGHEIGHIRLGHYEGGNLPAVRKVLGINSDIHSVGKSMAGEESFSIKEEYCADCYGTSLLKKARYNPRGLYNALKKIDDRDPERERNGFNSHPVSRERLVNIAEAAGFSACMEGNSLIGMEDIAAIMLGK